MAEDTEIHYLGEDIPEEFIYSKENPYVERFNKRFIARTDKKIGHGGYGTIYKGYDIHTGREVAIKVAKFRDEKSEKEFMEEARVTANIQHSNIIRVDELFVADTFEGERMAMALQLKDFNDNLWSRLNINQEPIPKEAIVSFVQQAGDALDYASNKHRGTITTTHRDIRPVNFFLEELEPGKWWTTVIDFGASWEVLKNTEKTIGDLQYSQPDATGH